MRVLELHILFAAAATAVLVDAPLEVLVAAAARAARRVQDREVVARGLQLDLVEGAIKLHHLLRREAVQHSLASGGIGLHEEVALEGDLGLCRHGPRGPQLQEPPQEQVPRASSYTAGSTTAKSQNGYMLMICGRMDGWMDGWMDEGTDICMEAWIVVKIQVWMDAKIDRSIDA